jgi:dihydrofolate reductase
MKVSLLVACDTNLGIGKNNALPWHLPSDLKFFKEKTNGHHILMGRKTYDSIGKPLPNRITLVVSRNASLEIPGTHTFTSITKAIDFARSENESELFIVGGAEIYNLALPLADTLYITRIENAFEVDAWLQISLENFTEISRDTREPDEKNKWKHHFVTYQRKKNST